MEMMRLQALSAAFAAERASRLRPIERKLL
jgi:hypothetical protein